MYIQNRAEREWIQNRVEVGYAKLPRDEQLARTTQIK